MKWYRKAKIDRRNSQRRMKEAAAIRCTCAPGQPICTYHKDEPDRRGTERRSAVPRDNKPGYKNMEPSSPLRPGKNVRKKS